MPASPAGTAALLPVPFHGDTVQLAAHEGQPVVPARPIVENLGLAWKPQYRKLASARKRWGVTIMVTPSRGGSQRTVCLPLRRLPAFLASIEPRKVKPAIRPKLELYQAECDEVLWQYWTVGQAARPVGGPDLSQNMFARIGGHRQRLNRLEGRIMALEQAGVAAPAAPPVAADPGAPACATTAIPTARYVHLLETENAMLRGRSRGFRPQRAKVPLTAEECAHIRSLAQSGLGVNEIARRTGRSPGSVSWVVRGAGPMAVRN